MAVREGAGLAESWASAPTGAWVTLGMLHSGHRAWQNICPPSLGHRMQEVKEWAGRRGACRHRGEGLCHPMALSPPSSLPRDSPLWGEGIQQGEQCHYNTVPLNYSPALGGNIVPWLFLLRYQALHPAQLLRPSPEHNTEQTGRARVPRAMASRHHVAPG